MARPKKIGLQYFPLDCDFDDKVDMLEVECGNDGFVAWIKILQQVYKTEIGELDISDVIRRKTYAKQANISLETWNNYIEIMVNIGLFDKTRYKKDNILTSHGIQERIKKVSAKRASAIERSKKRLENKDNTDLENSFSANNSETIDSFSANNERKSTEKESKSIIKNTNKKFIKPDQEEVIKYFLEKGGVKEQAENYFLSKESIGWKVGNSPLKNWHMDVQRWIKGGFGLPKDQSLFNENPNSPKPNKTIF